jgi:hypothetical protein
MVPLALFRRPYARPQSPSRAAHPPAAFSGLESLPQRFEVLPADVQRVKDFVVAHTGA